MKNNEREHQELAQIFLSNLKENARRSETERLRQKFHQDMLHLLDLEIERWGRVYSIRFQQMMDRNGDNGVEVAKKLLRLDREFPPKMFKQMVEAHQEDMTVEYLVKQKKYRELFTEEEISIAVWRLNPLSWKV